MSFQTRTAKLAGYGHDLNAARAEASRLLREVGVAEGLSVTFLATGVTQPSESGPFVVLSATAFQFGPAGFMGFDFDLERHRHGLYLNREKGSHGARGESRERLVRATGAMSGRPATG